MARTVGALSQKLADVLERPGQWTYLRVSQSSNSPRLAATPVVRTREWDEIRDLL